MVDATPAAEEKKLLLNKPAAVALSEAKGNKVNKGLAPSVA